VETFLNEGDVSRERKVRMAERGTGWENRGVGVVEGEENCWGK